MKRTSEEWAKLVPEKFNLKIMDPDGWDRPNFHYSYHSELITKEEFLNRVSGSTISVNVDFFNTEWEFKTPPENQENHPNLTKVCDTLSEFFKKKKHKFTFEIISGTGQFTIFCGSEEYGTMVECGKDGSVSVKYYADEEGNENDTDVDEDVEDPETWDPEPSFGEFMFNYKEVLRAYSKIQGHLNKIYDICENSNMEFDNFITIEHPSIEHPGEF